MQVDTQEQTTNKENILNEKQMKNKIILYGFNQIILDYN